MKLFEKDEAAQKKFESIHEEEDDINYQRQIKILLQSLDFEQEICNHINKYFGHLEGLEKVKENINLFGLVSGRDKEEFDFSNSDESDASEEKNNHSEETSIYTKQITTTGFKKRAATKKESDFKRTATIKTKGTFAFKSKPTMKKDSNLDSKEAHD